MRSITKTITAAAVLALALVACTKTGGTQHSWTKPGFLRVAIQADLKNLNPLLNSNTTDVFTDRLMFEPLLTADDKGNPLPMLATDVPTLENGGVSANGMTITYHLRHDVKWSDGVGLTAADVKWSWQAIMNPNNNVVSRHGYDYIDSIDTPDPYTVVVHLKTPFSPFVNTFFAESDQPYMVAPAHVLSKYPNLNQVPFNSNPTVTDGPFKFVQWAHGDHITVARNDDF
ncbi:MAG: ABC transporter substrate-binding protein, partial [Candidatus Cybelea sp.]